ncbi:hypothetical protein QFZ82_003156 [Streptomyces sp. V4I23]|uniref:hypothetical protein n=1 Tax=Streptomyces sp. V4I23 TaxID=3042282 RepID=UPI00277E9B87|nr:hypothetical protein [Streptomyces sp. V4I23]MDQ1008671.1 hypothetical protein [Streptomyces sp. V4I23]
MIEERQGFKVGCIEETVWRAGLIDDDRLRELAQPLRKSGYGNYLLGLLEGSRYAVMPQRGSGSHREELLRTGPVAPAQ